MNVFAHLLTIPLAEYRNGFRAYYSRAVTCGLSVDCTDHTPHEVVVRVGAHVRDVDPADWLGSMHAPIPRPLAALPLQPARPIAH